MEGKIVADVKKPRIQVKPSQLPVNQETLELLVANIIPTPKYFGTRFDHLEHRVIRIEDEIKDFRLAVDKHFEQMKIDSDPLRSRNQSPRHRPLPAL